MEAVREAEESDEARFSELAHEFIEDLVARRGGAQLVGTVDGGGDIPWPRALHELLADDLTLALIGTLDDAVTGFGVCHQHVRLNHRRGVLDACFVEPEARGIGLGRLLVDTMTSWLEAAGCDGVDGFVLPGARESKNLFEAAGFKARILVMHRSFDGEIRTEA